jgi:hypothetical protein
MLSFSPLLHIPEPITFRFQMPGFKNMWSRSSTCLCFPETGRLLTDKVLWLYRMEIFFVYLSAEHGQTPKRNNFRTLLLNQNVHKFSLPQKKCLYLLTYLLPQVTFLIIYLLHGAESFLRS